MAGIQYLNNSANIKLCLSAPINSGRLFCMSQGQRGTKSEIGKKHLSLVGMSTTKRSENPTCIETSCPNLGSVVPSTVRTIQNDADPDSQALCLFGRST